MIAVFRPGLKDPFNEWTDAHGRQGFSWRGESVSFLALDADDPPNIIVEFLDAYTQPMNALRVILVPFEVGSAGIIVSDYFTERPVGIPKGQCHSNKKRSRQKGDFLVKKEN